MSSVIENVTTNNKMFYILTEVKNGYSATEIHRKLVNAWGADIISLRRVQEVVREFKTGERESFTRLKGSGRPTTSSNEDNVEAIKNLVQQNNRLSCSSLETITGIPARSVNRIRSKNLNKRSLCARWVPYSLSDDHKSQREIQGKKILNSPSTRCISR